MTDERIEGDAEAKAGLTGDLSVTRGPKHVVEMVFEDLPPGESPRDATDIKGRKVGTWIERPGAESVLQLDVGAISALAAQDAAALDDGAMRIRFAWRGVLLRLAGYFENGQPEGHELLELLAAYLERSPATTEEFIANEAGSSD